MSAKGGAVAIWHDVAPEGLDLFHAWHGEEHMPERVSIPGFLSGRRFRAISADLGWFNLYETASPEVVRGPDYKARLDAPTPRTLATVKYFRDVARSLCVVSATASAAERRLAQGGLIATLRYDIAEAEEAAHLAILRDAFLAPLARSPGIARVTLLAADRAASGYVNAEQRARGDANAVPPVILLVEGWADEARFIEGVGAALSAARLREAGLTGDAVLGFYRHELTVTREAP